MDKVRSLLKPLTNLLPQEAQDFVATDLGLIVVIVAILLILLIVLVFLLSILKLLFGGKKNVQSKKEKGMEIDLDACPMPPKKAPVPRLFFHGEPVRLRLVVLAPSGGESDLDLAKVDRLLDKVLLGLGAQFKHDKPEVKVWPVQISQQGFAPTFFRKTNLAADEGEPSRWVLAAGRAMIGKKPLLLALGLWADQPSTHGRMPINDNWNDFLRLRQQSEDDE